MRFPLIIGLLPFFINSVLYGQHLKPNDVTDSAGKLDSSKNLTEVTVSASKPLIEQKADRTIFNIGNSVTAIGGDALDALKKTPGVTVVNDQIMIAGSGGVSIMINGRLQKLSGKDLAQMLRTISSDNLSRIEVITAPPAGYDAEGGAGIINIVTKKTSRNGFRGSITADYNQNTFGSPSISTSLNFVRKDFNFYCTIRTGSWSELNTNLLTSYYPSQVWTQTLDDKWVQHFTSGQFGADYNLRKNMAFGVIFEENHSSVDTKDVVNAMGYSNSSNLDSILHTNATSHQFEGKKTTVDLNYEWKIDATGKRLLIDAEYFAQSSGVARDFDVQTVLPDNSIPGEPSLNRTIVSQTIGVKSIKADVEWPTAVARFSFGGKSAIVSNQSDNIYKVSNGVSYLVDSSRTNSFVYTEQIDAAYINAQKAIGRLEMQFGLRGEYTWTNGYLPTTGQSNITHYFQLFPSGYLQYKLNEKNTFGFNLTRRINRPGYNLLNPYRFYYDSRSWSEGNPTLQPSYNTRAELSYTLRSNYTFRIFARNVSNYWDRISIVDTATQTVDFKRANVGQANYYGVIFNVTVRPLKNWDSHISAYLQHSHFELNYYGDKTSYNNINAWFETSNSLYLNKRKTLSAEVNGYYYSPRQVDYKKWPYIAGLDAGIKWMLLDKNLILALSSADILGTAIWRLHNLSDGTISRYYDDERSVRFAITYKFGNSKLKSKRDRDIVTDEIQRANQ